MESWIKISGTTYYVVECDVQLSMESWASMHMRIDLRSHPSYYDDFIDLYEKGSSFSICAKRFSASVCRIKSIDIDFGKSMTLAIRCEKLDAHDISERREGIIDDILGDETTLRYVSI